MIKFDATQLVDMLRLQNTLNVNIAGPLWRDKRYEWHRAAWVECGELLDHIGWKWWKSHTPDLAQAQLEVVDIWHFCLSYALEATHAQLGTDDPYVVADSIRNDMVLAETSLTYGYKAQVTIHGEARALLNLVELLVAQCTNDQQVSPAITLELAEALGLDADNMYKLYLGKNLINIFRQEYGYKTGQYHKTWGGQEDNEVLIDIMKAHPDWTSTLIYEELRVRYGRPVPAANAS